MTTVSRVYNVLIALLAGSAALLSLGCGGGSGDDTVIAVVNGEKVTKNQYLKKLETMSSVRAVNPPQNPLQPGQIGEVQVAEPLSAQALTGIIDEILTLQTAKDEGLLPSKEEVDREQALMEQLNPNYVKGLKSMGFTLEDIRRQLMVRLAERNLLVRGIPKKTLADAKRYIAEHPDEFTVPAQVRLRWIVLDDPNLRDDVDRELGSGITFGAVAGKYSTAANARAENGAFPPGRGPQPTPQPMPDKATNPFWEAVLKTPKGRVSHWFELPGAGGKKSYVKLLVEDKTEKTVRKLSAAEEEMVRRALEEREARDVNDLTDLYLKKLLNAKIEINVPYLKATWEQQLALIKDRAARMEERVGSASGPSTSGADDKPNGK